MRPGALFLSPPAFLPRLALRRCSSALSRNAPPSSQAPCAPAQLPCQHQRQRTTGSGHPTPSTAGASPTTDPVTPGQKKTLPGCPGRVFCNKSLAVTYFHMGEPTLSSARSSFTSEFGMGSGGSHLLFPPGKLSGHAHVGPKIRLKRSTPPSLLGCYMVKPHGQLVPVSFTRHRASTPGLSTW